MAPKSKKPAPKSKAKPKPKGRAAKLAKAIILPFVKPKAKKPVVPPKKQAQVDRKSKFAELGTSLFPLMTVTNMNKNTPGATFTSRHTRAIIMWPADAAGVQQFVPTIALTLRNDDGSSELHALTPAVAAQIAAALAVSMSELEIQCPGNVALSGKHWTLLVQRMRELKMIDADMPADYIAEPGLDEDNAD